MDRTQTGAEQRLQFDLRSFLAILVRRKWVLAAVSLPIITIAVIGTLRSAESFTAVTHLLVEARSPVNPTLRQTGTVDYEVLMSTEAQLAASMPVASLAAESLMDSLASLAAEDVELADVEQPTQLARILYRYMDASPVGSSNILELTFTHPSERFCRVAADALAKAFIQFSVRSHQNTSAVDYYTDQINALQASLDSLINLRAEAYAKGGINALPAAMQNNFNEIQRMEYDYFTARAKRRSLQQQLERLRLAVAEDPEYVPAIGAGENDALVRAKQQLEDEKSKLMQLQSTYTDSSVWVQRQREIVEKARRELSRTMGDYLTHMEIELEGLRATEESLAEAIAEARARLTSFPETTRLVESLDLQIAAQRDLLESLQLKRGEVRLAMDSDVRISNITQLDEPRIEASVAGGKKILYLFMVIILAIVLGVVSAIFVDNQDHRILDRRTAEQALDVPVLGSIRSDEGTEDGT